jgi:hypothetical protein
MENKFEAVIDLEAQPLTDAVRTAIAGLQALASELEKANSSLNQAAGGMDASAVAADSVAGSAMTAAGALNEEAKASAASAAAHEKHAASAKKDADQIRAAAESAKKMREGLLVGSTLLRIGSSVAASGSNENVSRALDLAGSALSAVAMKAMMGAPGLIIGIGETTAKGIDWIIDAEKKGSDRITAIRQARQKSGFDFADQWETVEKTKSYNELLRAQVQLDNEILSIERQLQMLAMSPASRDSETQQSLLQDRLNYAVRVRNFAGSRESGLLTSDNGKTLSDFDKIRQEAIGNKSFELDLINAKSESDKIDVIERRMKQLRAEGESKEAAARAGQNTMDPVVLQKLLEEAASLLGEADTLQTQLADARKGKRVDLPALAGPSVQVDPFWSRGLFLGGGSSTASMDYNRRIAAASEKTAKNTERLLSMGPQTATWEG